ncbi:MAG: hypothetical protein Q9173_001706 [Seirophora scorigena]
MVPKAYPYWSSPERSLRRPDRDDLSNPIRHEHTGQRTTARPQKLATASTPAPSQPVIIPTRTRKDSYESALRSRAGGVTEGCAGFHDPLAMPPSVAAFRAISSSSSTRKPVTRFGAEAHKPFEENDGDATDNDLIGTASSLSSPHSWRLLLSPLGDIDDDTSLVFGTDETMLESPSPLRSLSTESMPSLDTDTESACASSSPSTPGLRNTGRNLLERKSKSISSSVLQDSSSDHPLLIVRTKDKSALNFLSTNNDARNETLPTRTRPSIRSNLTASLRRLKYAARNLSSTNPRTIVPDVDQARVTLSQASQFASERRPLPCAEPPDPALRRYLNPITVSPVELYTYRDNGDHRSSPSGCAASIQMQTYRPGARKSEKASTPPTFVLSSSRCSPLDEPAVAAAPRHREPRENSDFLRVIVLEMNMRKVGKLSDAAPSRARLWLPARQAMHGDSGDTTPRRWKSVSS